ncbi:DUF4199 domain-containing protein [Flavobacterium adhaerens]|uniref:DUF4199 domain-containing protein n=1 Tax=Flavobacterium adhaerens TaxID=3149043 RepID=UPI0032B45F08
MINEIIKRNGVTFGVTIGIISSLITATIYAIDINLFLSGWLGAAIIGFYLIICIVLLVKTKKDLNGVMPFKDAFTTYFIAVLIGIIISTLFNIVLFNFIDPSAKDTLKELTAKYTIEMMQKFGTPESAIKEAVAKLKESNPYSIIELAKGAIYSIVFSSILGLILAAFFKSNATSQEYK